MRGVRSPLWGIGQKLSAENSRTGKQNDEKNNRLAGRGVHMQTFRYYNLSKCPADHSVLAPARRRWGTGNRRRNSNTWRGEENTEQEKVPQSCPSVAFYTGTIVPPSKQKTKSPSKATTKSSPKFQSNHFFAVSESIWPTMCADLFSNEETNSQRADQSFQQTFSSSCWYFVSHARNCSNRKRGSCPFFRTSSIVYILVLLLSKSLENILATLSYSFARIPLCKANGSFSGGRYFSGGVALCPAFHSSSFQDPHIH